ncbi:MAG TPA: NAD(P)-binding oxidoreductase [Streptosporangiaceae bacterium]|nr:NAD(P)-binding oxidoreductase [Streptosporangiaceae bacterium]
MRIAVFGSTGGNGRLLLAQAVRRGHEVTAFARQARALDDTPGLAGIVEGDARDLSLAAKAVAGQQAVIMTVSGGGEPGVGTAIARTVVQAMDASGVPRLVATSAYGIVARKPYVAAPLIRRIFRAVFADQAAADEVIAASDLDWTIARATRLVGGQPRRPARVDTALFRGGPYSVSRQAYASVLLDLAENGGHPRQFVNVTG